MTRQEMIDLIGWHYQTMTVEEQNILSRVEHIVEVAVLRERNACANECEAFYSIEGIAQKCSAAIRSRT